jgi:hypothetical protein
MNLIWVPLNLMGPILGLETGLESIARKHGKRVHLDEKQSGVEGRGEESGVSCHEKLYQR